MACTHIATAEYRASNIWHLSFLSILVLLAHLVVSRTYSNWFWGFNHYHFIGRNWSLFIVSVGCVLCLPWVWYRLSTWYAWASRLVCGLPVPRSIVDLTIAATMGVLFWLLRMPNHFLGDGRLLIRLLEQGKWFHQHEPLDRMIHYAVLKLARPFLGWDAETVYAVLSVGAGIIYVLAALRLGTLLRSRLFVVACLLTLGTVQLFLGYVESYSLATSLMLIYIVLVLEHLAGKRSLAHVGCTLLIGVALHHALLFLVPSFAYLLVIRTGQSRNRNLKNTLLGVGLLVAIAGLVLITSRGWKTAEMSLLLVPWAEDPVAQYTLVSFKHLVDFVNQQILISPLAWIIALVFGVAFWRDRRLRRSSRLRFLYLVSACPLAFSMILRPGLGGSRDWDLFSMGSLPYAVVAAIWLARDLGERKELRYAAYAVVIIGLFHILPWIVVNRSAELSTNRFSLMVEDNPLWTDKRIAAARAELAYSYLERDLLSDAAEHLEAAVTLDPDRARYLHDLGITYAKLGKLDQAEVRIRQAVDLDPLEAKSSADLGQIYLLKGRTEEAEPMLRRAVELDPSLSQAHFNLGRLYEDWGEIGQATESYIQAVTVNPNVAVYWYRLANTLESVPGREDEAKNAWRRIVELAEKDPSQVRLHREALNRMDRLGRSSPLQSD